MTASGISPFTRKADPSLYNSISVIPIWISTLSRKVQPFSIDNKKVKAKLFSVYYNMEDQNIYSFKLEVDKERLDKLLTNYFIEYSRSAIQKWIASNHVKIDGKICNQKILLRTVANVSIYPNLILKFSLLQKI